MAPINYGSKLSPREASERFQRQEKRGVYKTHDGRVSFIMAQVGSGKYINELADNGNTLFYCASKDPSDQHAMAFMRDHQLPVRVLLVVDVSQQYDWGEGLITAQVDRKVERGRIQDRYRIVRVTDGALKGQAPAGNDEAARSLPALAVTPPFATSPLPDAGIAAPLLTDFSSSSAGIATSASKCPAVLPSEACAPPESKRRCLGVASCKRVPIGTMYRGCAFKSLLEAKHACFFTSLGLQWHYEGSSTHRVGPQNATYTIDFWLPDIQTHVEIKPRTPYDTQRVLCEELCRRWRQDVVLLYNTTFTVPFAEAEEDGLAYEHADGIRGMRWRFDRERRDVVFEDGIVWVQDAEDAWPRLDARTRTDDRRCFAPALLRAYQEATAASLDHEVMCPIPEAAADDACPQRVSLVEAETRTG